MSRRPPSRRALGVLVFFLLCALSCSQEPETAQETPPPERWLDPQSTLTESLENGQSLSFKAKIRAGDFLRIRALQRSVDITLKLADSRGHEIAFFDSENYIDGPEWLVAAVERTDDYLLEVHGIAGSGHVEIVVETLGSASSSDLALAEALEALAGMRSSPIEQALERLDAVLQEKASTSALPNLILARTHRARGRLRQELGILQPAIEDLRSASGLFGRFGNGWEQAPALNDLAYSLILAGHLDDAEAVLAQSIHVSDPLDFKAAIADYWTHRGILSTARGQHSEALRAHGVAEKLYQETGARRGQAASLHNVGTELLHLGRIDDGLEVLGRAIELRRLLGDPIGRAQAQVALGWGLELRAEKSKSQGLRSTGRRSEATRSKEPRAKDRSIRQALAAYDEAVEILEQHQARWDLALALERRAHLYLEIGELDVAQKDLERALELGHEADDMHEAWIRLGLGSVLREMGQLQEAHTELAFALRFFKEAGHHHGRVSTGLEMARAERQAGLRHAASENLEEAIRRVERARKDVWTSEFRRSFLAPTEELFTELVDLYAESALMLSTSTQATDRALAQRYAAQAFEVSERFRARTLLDLVTSPSVEAAPSSASQARLEGALSALESRQISEGSSPAHLSAWRRFRLEWGRQEASSSSRGDLRSAEPEEAIAIQALLDDDTTLLAFHLGTARSWLFALTKTDLRVFPLPEAAAIEAAARRSQELVQRAGQVGFGLAAKAAWLDLAELLFGSLDASSLDRARLLIVPAGPLHLIPFGLLPLDQDKILMSRSEVLHLPSASALVQLRLRSKARPPAKSLIALIADPVFSPRDRRLRPEEPTSGLRAFEGSDLPHFPRLKGTEQEAQQIADLARNFQRTSTPAIFSAFEASHRLFSGDQLEGYRLLHIATHGLVDSADPALAGLVFSLFNADGLPERGFLSARNLYELNLDAELVVLSACQSGLGQSVRGEGLVGLSHGFFAAGAKTLVVSLWEVGDRATMELMIRFYGHLFELGGSPAQALRRAQLEMAQSSRWSSSKHWGGFVLLGDWQMSLSHRHTP